MGKKLLSIIIPCYNEEKTVETIYVAITDTMDMLPQYDYEILFVNDGSKDNTLNKLTGLSEMDVHVKYYSFSRNFGKEAAIYAGLNNARGDYVVIMDADMQDPPALLPEMISTLESGEYAHFGCKIVGAAKEMPVFTDPALNCSQFVHL